MIDTITIESLSISEDVAQKIEKQSILRQGIDMKNQEIFYQITTSQLLGSFDSSLRIVVKRQRLKSTYDWRSRKNVVNNVNCKPYLLVECSPHKLILGHNVYGGSNDFQGYCRFLIKFIEESFNVLLPDFRIWHVRRIDYAEVFDLGSIESVLEYFRGLNSAVYSRRSANKYGLTGTYYPGGSTTVKFYCKGEEFRKHDKVRLKKFLDDDKLYKIEEIAKRLLRVEVEIKSRKLKNDFKSKYLPCVKDIKLEYLQSLYENEIKKIIKEGDSSMKTVRNAQGVQNRLYSLFSSQKASVMLGTWYMFTTLGEDYAKTQMSESTFYRHKKDLKDSGISWLGTNVTLKDSNLIPLDFTPLLKDVRIFNHTDEKIIKALAV